MDLLFNIDILQSNKLKRLVIDTYKGEIKNLKSKTFSGQLSRVELELELFNNFSQNELIKIKDNLHKATESQISKYKYVIKDCDNIFISRILMQGKSLYCTPKNEKMYLIENIEYIQTENRSIKIKRSRNSINLKIGEYNIKIRNLNNIINLDNSSIILTDNELIFLDKKFSNHFFKGVNILSEIIFDENNLNDHMNEYYIKPKVNLYLDFYDKYIQGTLYMQYNEVEISPYSTQEKIICGDKVYYRNIYEEKEMLKIFMQYNWSKVRENKFKKKTINDNEIDNYINNNIYVYMKKTKKAIKPFKINIRINNRIDWLELNGNIFINDKLYDLYNIIKSSNKENYIEIDGSICIIPKKINDLFRNVNIKNNSILLSKNRIGQLAELSNTKYISNIKGIETCIEYSNVNIDLPNVLKNILKGYQIDGVKWLKYLYKNKIGGCLADDMGLGKTIQIIGFLSDKEFNVNYKKILIIVPKTLLVNWYKEFKRYNKDINVLIYHGSDRKEGIEKFNNGVLISTYKTITNDMNIFKDKYFDCLIIDEIQYIKNFNTQSYKSLKALNSTIKIGLSGTPFENNITEVWSIMEILNSGVWGKRNDFIKRYENNLRHLHDRISPYVLRRTKKDVLNELPEKEEINIYCDMTNEQRNLYNLIKIDIKSKLCESNRYKVKSNSCLLEGLLYLREACCHTYLLPKKYNYNNIAQSGKFEFLKKLIEQTNDNKEKIIVFSSFTSMLNIIAKWLEKKKYKYYYLDGKVKEKQTIVDKFENSEEGVFLISIKVGGVGLNMTSCKYAVIYDPWWNPAVEDQAADRIYRIGQKNNVTVYRLITNDSIEEKILDLKEDKMKIGDSIFNDLNCVRNISFEEIKKLISS